METVIKASYPHYTVRNCQSKMSVDDLQNCVIISDQSFVQILKLWADILKPQEQLKGTDQNELNNSFQKPNFSDGGSFWILELIAKGWCKEKIDQTLDRDYLLPVSFTIMDEFKIEA